MLQLSERLQQNIAFVLGSSLELEEQAASSALSQPGKLTMLCYAASELALTALISSDEVESLFLPREEQLLQREVASALRQIALHALDIQAWELPDAIRAELAAIRKYCETLANCVVLPPEPEAPAPAPLVPAEHQAPAQTEAQGLMLFTPTTEEDEVTRLRTQIRALRELLADLVQERDELVHVICRELEARYYRELGSLEAEVFRADGLVNYFRRRAEYLRAARNRDEKPDLEKVEQKLRKDLEEYQKVYEEFTRRAKEAEAQRPKRAGKSTSLAETKTGDKASDPQGQENVEDEIPSEEAEAEDKILSEEDRLKRLYRRIVKAMHPDLHPEQDEATRTLFKRAIQAYKDGDLKTLQEIDGMCADTEPEPGQDPLQALREEKQRLLDLVFSLRYEIRHIKTRFPYTKKKLLDDPELLAAEKKRLEQALFQLRQQAERYRREVADLEGKI